MGLELELIILLAIQTVGTSVFARFETETPIWKRLLKWFIVHGGTIGLYFLVGHWPLLFPLALSVVGGALHFVVCRKHGFDPVYARPRRAYYAFRGREWPE